MDSEHKGRDVSLTGTKKKSIEKNQYHNANSGYINEEDDPTISSRMLAIFLISVP